MNAIDLIYLFPRELPTQLLGPHDEELYSGSAYKCAAWLMKNTQYDIFPDNGGIWADVQNGTLVILLDEIYDD